MATKITREVLKPAGKSKLKSKQVKAAIMAARSKKAKPTKAVKEEAFLELDGTINYVVVKGKKVVSREPIDGKVVLELILAILKEELNV